MGCCRSWPAARSRTRLGRCQRGRRDGCYRTEGSPDRGHTMERVVTRFWMTSRPNQHKFSAASFPALTRPGAAPRHGAQSGTGPQSVRVGTGRRFPSSLLLFVIGSQAIQLDLASSAQATNASVSKRRQRRNACIEVDLGCIPGTDFVRQCPAPKRGAVLTDPGDLDWLRSACRLRKPSIRKTSLRVVRTLDIGQDANLLGCPAERFLCPLVGSRPVIRNPHRQWAKMCLCLLLRQ